MCWSSRCFTLLSLCSHFWWQAQLLSWKYKSSMASCCLVFVHVCMCVCAHACMYTGVYVCMWKRWAEGSRVLCSLSVISVSLCSASLVPLTLRGCKSLVSVSAAGMDLQIKSRSLWHSCCPMCFSFLGNLSILVALPADLFLFTTQLPRVLDHPLYVFMSSCVER